MILVTGSSGFVGSAVCCELKLRGRCLLRAVRGHEISDDPAVVVGDIDSKMDWSTALNDVGAVVHLAARVHQMCDTAVDPLAEFRKMNVGATRRLAEAAAQAGVKRFVFLSSVKVNGDVTETNGGPFREANLPHPEDAYAVSKWEAELVLREIEQKSSMEVVIIRPPLIYGPGVKANFLKLIQLIDRGIPLPFGCIQNRRSLLSLSNLVDLIYSCLEHPAAAGETFLVSDGDDVSTPELVRRIASALGRPARLLPVPEWMMKMGGNVVGKTDQVKRLTASLQIDSSKVQQVLAWEPPLKMAEEMTRMAKWWREQNCF